MGDGVEVAHQDEGDVHVLADAFQLREEALDGHSVAQGLAGGALDHGAVGDRVAEGDADLDHVHALGRESPDDVRRAVEGRGAGAEVDGEQALGPAAEKSVYTVHNQLSLKVFKEYFQQVRVLDARGGLEAAVEVEAREERIDEVVERLHGVQA